MRKAGILKPLLLGGGADEFNVAEVLEHADGVIVSSALKRKDVSPDEMVLWDLAAALNVSWMLPTKKSDRLHLK